MNPLRLSTLPSRAVLGVLLAAVLLLSACGRGAGESWAGLASNGQGDTLGDTVYVSYNQRVVALRVSDGKRVWQYPKEGDRDGHFFAIPVIDREAKLLYVGDYNGQLHAIHLETVEDQWNAGNGEVIYRPAKEQILGPIEVTPKDRVISGVALGDERVFFGLGSQNVVALSRQTGDFLWEFPTDHGVWSTPLYVPAAGDRAAGLYVVSLDHRIYAIDPETGAELWHKDLGGAAPGNITYDAKNHRVYVGTFLSELLAIDLQNGKIIDRFETEGWIWSGPALEYAEDVQAGQETAGTARDMLYFGDLKGYLYAVAVTPEGTFEQVWKKSVSKESIRATPLLTDDREDGLVIVGSKDKYIYAVSKKDGARAWKEETEGEVLTELVLVEDDGTTLVVVGTSEREELVIAFRSDSGERDWKYSDKDD